MKIIQKDLIKLGFIMLLWLVARSWAYKHEKDALYEALSFTPIHLIITLAVYAVVSVSYKIIFIKDCNDSHRKLLEDLDDARRFFEKNKLKYE